MRKILLSFVVLAGWATCIQAQTVYLPSKSSGNYTTVDSATIKTFSPVLAKADEPTLYKNSDEHDVLRFTMLDGDQPTIMSLKKVDGKFLVSIKQYINGKPEVRQAAVSRSADKKIFHELRHVNACALDTTASALPPPSGPWIFETKLDQKYIIIDHTTPGADKYYRVIYGFFKENLGSVVH